MIGNFFTDGNAGDAELIAASVVALHEDADGIAAGFSIEHAGSSADAAFEFVADHSGAAADIAFFDGAGVGDVEGVPGVFGMNVESVDVVEPAVPGFGNDGQGPEVAFHVRRRVLHFPGDDGVAYDPDAVRVGDHYGSVEKAGVFDPGGSGHFAVAVEGEPGGEDGVVGSFAARVNRGDAGAHGTFADYEFAIAGDESGVSDFEAFHVSDGVVGAGSAVEGDAEIAGAGLGLGGCGEGEREDDKERERLRASIFGLRGASCEVRLQAVGGHGASGRMRSIKDWGRARVAGHGARVGCGSGDNAGRKTGIGIRRKKSRHLEE